MSDNFFAPVARATITPPSRGGAHSVGLNIKLPHEQAPNGYAETVIHFDYFFARKVMFVKYACAFVGLPGGYGTLDEMFDNTDGVVPGPSAIVG